MGAIIETGSVVCLHNGSDILEAEEKHPHSALD